MGYGEESGISFPTGKDLLYLIKGDNRYGKTSFFKSISWCLYGRLRRGYSSEFDYDLADLKHADSKKPAFVEVYFEHGNKAHRIRREIAKIGGKLSSSVSLAEEGVIISEDPDEVREIISEIIPEDIHSFFLFDGEEVKEVMEKQEDELIKSSIEKLIGLSFVSDALVDLDMVKGDLDSEYTKTCRSDRKLSKLANDCADARENKSKVEQQIRDTKKKLANLMAEKRSVERDIEKAGNARITKIMSKARELNDKIEKKETEKEELEERLSGTLRAAPFFILQQKIERTQEELERNISKLEEKFDDEYAHHLLLKSLKTKDKKCLVCGNDLKKHKRPLDLEKKKGIRLELDSKKQIYNMLNSASEGILEFESPAKCEEKIEEIKQTIAKLKAESKNVDKMLDVEKTSSDLIERKKRKRESLETEIATQNKRIATDEADLQALTELSSELQEKLTRTGSKTFDSGKEQIKEQIDLTEKLIASLQKFRSRARLRRRDEVLEGAWEFFKKLTKDDKSYSRFEYKSPDDYSIQAFNQAGAVIPMRNLSGAEKQALVLSLILGINQYTEYKAPIIIDSPLHRLGKDFRAGFLEVLSKLPNQVMLLIIPQEFEEVMESSKKRVTKTYSINRHFEEYYSELGE